MSKFITTLFASTLFASTSVVLAVEAQPMEESTHPNSVNDVPVENVRQEPDRNSGSAGGTGSRMDNRMEYSDREYMERWSESNTGGTGSAGGRGTNNPNSNSDVSGGDQIDAGTAGSKGKVEKLKQKPNKE